MPNIENDTDDVVLRASGIEHTYDSPLPSALPFGRTVEVLDGADLAVRAGEIVGVVGENGSGKSTLLEVLVGALDPDAGEVAVDGRLGWCPQEPLLYDRLTVAETVRLFGVAYGLSDEEIREARDRYADSLGFAEYLDYRIDHLSGGNRQKVNLAVALLADPDVVLLDEPYTGFDWRTYLAFWELTEALTDRGTAIVVVSHFVSERERFDRILELSGGRLHDVTGESTGDGTGADARGTRAEARSDGGSRRGARTDAHGVNVDD